MAHLPRAALRNQRPCGDFFLELLPNLQHGVELADVSGIDSAHSEGVDVSAGLADRRSSNKQMWPRARSHSTEGKPKLVLHVYHLQLPGTRSRFRTYLSQVGGIRWKRCGKTPSLPFE